MPRLLLPVDGSDASTHAVEYLVGMLAWYRDEVDLHVLNVQHPLPGDVSMFISPDQLHEFHQQEGRKALAATCSRLDAAGRRYVAQVRVGDPSEEIVGYAKTQHCDQICMGTRGLGGVAGLLLGSVSSKVIHLSTVPVLLIK